MALRFRTCVKTSPPIPMRVLVGMWRSPSSRVDSNVEPSDTTFDWEYTKTIATETRHSYTVDRLEKHTVYDQISNDLALRRSKAKAAKARRTNDSLNQHSAFQQQQEEADGAFQQQQEEADGAFQQQQEEADGAFQQQQEEADGAFQQQQEEADSATEDWRAGEDSLWQGGRWIKKLPVMFRATLFGQKSVDYDFESYDDTAWICPTSDKEELARLMQIASADSSAIRTDKFAVDLFHNFLKSKCEGKEFGEGEVQEVFTDLFVPFIEKLLISKVGRGRLRRFHRENSLWRVPSTVAAEWRFNFARIFWNVFVHPDGQKELNDLLVQLYLARRNPTPKRLVQRAERLKTHSLKMEVDTIIVHFESDNVSLDGLQWFHSPKHLDNFFQSCGLSTPSQSNAQDKCTTARAYFDKFPDHQEASSTEAVH